MRFQAPTRIYFGSGMISRLKEITEELSKEPGLFLVTDRGIIDSGIADKVFHAFPGIQVFDEVEQNPKHTTVDKAGEIARKLKPDLIIGLGGGSALDAAKAVALLATNPGRIEDYEGKGKYKSPPLPVLAIPTTCGTASEVTWVSVITHTERLFKMSIKGPLMFPAVALVDPDLLVTLPPPLIASTGMDALTHAIEAYTVKPATFMTDIFARESLQLIFQSLERAYRNIKDDREAREMIMKGSMIAGMAFGNSDVGAVHCIAEAVGSLYDTPHGVANSVFLPYVMEFNLPAAKSRYAEIARIAGIQEEETEAAARKLIRKIKDLSHSLSIPAFRDLGIEKDKFAEIAEKSFQNNSNPSNPREAGVADYMGILERAYSD
ncbi:MAG: iron-containing alcohol dehydrogenase [Candidatus Aminicenantes bacterium]|nr:MAG: iron-containing alcohol dehydrogenase [Candidatus Aminicenantes bacterium]